MGGPGSGSWYRWDTRRVIDTVDSLDVRKLARQGALREGVQAVITWRQGQQGECSIKFACESRGIVLTYRAQRAGGAWCDVHQEIPIERVSTGFGTRALLKCSECQRRAAIVYLSHHLLFVCRVCMALPYKSQCEMLDDRLYRRMQKIRRRLGAAPGDMQQPVWHHQRPKGMHQSTYERIGELAEEARMQLLQARNMKLAKLLSRYVPVGEAITWRRGS
jgi:hypothetical protein